MSLRYLPLDQLERIRAADADPADRAAAFADACRINALYMIARAGSGHIGTSFSCMDILAWLHLEVLRPEDRYPTDQQRPPRDVDPRANQQPQQGPNPNGQTAPIPAGPHDKAAIEQWYLADAIPDAPALACPARTASWAHFDRRADALAAALLTAGVAEQDKVAQYLYNGPEYLESVFACWKAGLAPVNTNYRYGPDELTYLWDNADVVAVVFHGAFADRIEDVRGRVPRVRTWLWADDGSGDCPSWAQPYEAAASADLGWEIG